MKFNSRKTLSVVALTSMMSVTPIAAFSAKDVVVDKNGNYIHSFSGGCVRTMWQAESDKCRVTSPVEHKASSVPASSRSFSRSFLVFFDFNSASLTSDAKQVIADVYSSAKGDASFSVVGHADKSGSDNYNLMLSKKRAEIVKSELARMGASSVKSKWKGESDPLVSTEDGIKEPQNRRTEIRVHYGN